MNNDTPADAMELKPCPTPWCGPEHEKYTWQGPDDLFCVICDGCQVEGPSCENEVDAHDAWNTRTDVSAAALRRIAEGNLGALPWQADYAKIKEVAVLALAEAARDAGDVLQSAATPSRLDPQYSEEIAALGERIGYGALMHGASALWRKSLGELAGSEFAAGPCVSTAESRLVRLDDALMPFRGETLPAAPSLAAQDGLVDALQKIAGLNDLEDAPHDAIEAYARNALYECELIARAALASIEVKS